MVLAVDSNRAQRMPRDERRSQLLSAAVEIFGARGYHAASMDEVAEAAGVSKPVLYQHFPSKFELYLALLDQVVDDLIGRVQAAVDSTTHNRERVAATMAAFLDFVNDPQRAYRLVFESDLPTSEPVQERLWRLDRELGTRIGAVIASDTDLPLPEAELLAVSLIGIAEVSARIWSRDPQGIALDRARELISSLAWRGIRGFPRTSAATTTAEPGAGTSDGSVDH